MVRALVTNRRPSLLRNGSQVPTLCTTHSSPNSRNGLDLNMWPCIMSTFVAASSLTSTPSSTYGLTLSSSNLGQYGGKQNYAGTLLYIIINVMILEALAEKCPVLKLARYMRQQFPSRSLRGRSDCVSTNPLQSRLERMPWR
jgi:hypothetical protein